MKKIGLILITCLLLGSVACADDNDFRNVKWGMAQEEVIKTESMKPANEAKDSLKYNLDMYQWRANLNYYFDINGNLNNAEYNFINHIPATMDANALDQMGVALYQTLQSDLTQKYGKPQENNTIWSNESFKSLPENLGAHVSQGHLVLSTIWETDRAIIVLSCKRGYQFLHPYADSKISYYEKSYYQSLNQQIQKPNPDSKNL
jgi:hypothetical protein